MQEWVQEEDYSKAQNSSRNLSGLFEAAIDESARKFCQRLHRKNCRSDSM